MPIVWSFPDKHIEITYLDQDFLAKSQKPDEMTADAVMRLAVDIAAKAPYLRQAVPQLVKTADLPTDRSKRKDWTLDKSTKKVREMTKQEKDARDNPPKPPKPDDKDKKIVKYVKADEHCKDKYYKYFLPVYLKKGTYKVEFESWAFSPYHKYKYIKLDYVYVAYKDEYYEKQKERIKEKDYEKIEIPYDQYVKVYFKDKICKDNKGFGKIKFEKKKDYEKPPEVEKPPVDKPPPSYEPPKKDEDDKGYDD